jgi:putative DNA primase/helicase
MGAENVVAPTLEGLASNFGLAPLIGKPVAIIGDARISPRSPNLASIVERLLGISGEDTFTIDRKYLPEWTGKLPTRLVILVNELPRLPDQAEALASRYLILRFTKSFIGREDKQLDAKLQAERPAILLRAIEGWKRLRDRGHFVQPDSGQPDVDQVLDISSPVGAYARERLVVSEHATEDVPIVFADWCAWCESKRRDPGDESTFGRNLRTVVPTLVTKPRRGEKSKGEKNYVRVFHGVAIRIESGPDSSDDPTVARGSAQQFDEVVTQTIASTGMCAVARNIPSIACARREEEYPSDICQRGVGGEDPPNMEKTIEKLRATAQHSAPDFMNKDPRPF